MLESIKQAKEEMIEREVEEKLLKKEAFLESEWGRITGLLSFLMDNLLDYDGYHFQTESYDIRFRVFRVSKERDGFTDKYIECQFKVKSLETRLFLHFFRPPVISGYVNAEYRIKWERKYNSRGNWEKHIETIDREIRTLLSSDIIIHKNGRIVLKGTKE